LFSLLSKDYLYSMKNKFLPAYFLTFVNTLGASILMPVLPFIVKDFGADKWVYGLLITLYSIFQFFGAPWLGSLSDSRGRKPVLIISHIGTLIAWFVFVIALMIPDISWMGMSIPLVIIALSRILDGITGGNNSVANAYVADITTNEEKMYIFGYLGGISGIALIIGPGLGGISASGPLGHLGTAFTAIAISSVTLLIMWKGLKESLPLEKRKPRKKESISSILNIPKRLKDANPDKAIKIIFITKMLFGAMLGTYFGTIALFLIDTFNFNERELGTFMLVVGVFLAFNQAFLSKRFIKKFGEFPTLIIGLLFCAIGLFTITLTTNLYLFIACYYFMNLGLSLCFPTFNALISIHADEQKKGEILGISESIMSLNLAIFPFIAAFLYHILEDRLFHITALLPFAGVIIALIALKKLGKKTF